jgi:hypothetical protein
MTCCLKLLLARLGGEWCKQDCRGALTQQATLMMVATTARKATNTDEKYIFYAPNRKVNLVEGEAAHRESWVSLTA